MNGHAFCKKITLVISTLSLYSWTRPKGMYIGTRVLWTWSRGQEDHGSGTEQRIGYLRDRRIPPPLWDPRFLESGGCGDSTGGVLHGILRTRGPGPAEERRDGADSLWIRGRRTGGNCYSSELWLPGVHDSRWGCLFLTTLLLPERKSWLAPC